MKIIERDLFWTSSKSTLYEFPNRPIYLVINDKIYPSIILSYSNNCSTRNFYKL